MQVFLGKVSVKQVLNLPPVQKVYRALLYDADAAISQVRLAKLRDDSLKGFDMVFSPFRQGGKLAASPKNLIS